ncbi:MAG: hypothetical protein HY053_05275 [Proteobacteria bacterium]|nr:hypothetical protein [Pseudomonadota bacterium]
MSGTLASADPVLSRALEAQAALKVMEENEGLAAEVAIHTYFTTLQIAFPTREVSTPEYEILDEEHAANFIAKRKGYQRILAEITAHSDRTADFSANIFTGLLRHPCPELAQIFHFIWENRPQAFTDLSLHMAAMEPRLQTYAHQITMKRPELVNENLAAAVLGWLVDGPRHNTTEADKHRLAYRSGILQDILDVASDAITPGILLTFLSKVKKRFGVKASPALAECLEIIMEDIVPGRGEVFSKILEDNAPPEWESIVPIRDASRMVRKFGALSRLKTLEDAT